MPKLSWPVGTRFTCADHEYEIVGRGKDDWGDYCVTLEDDGVSRHSFVRLTAALKDGRIVLTEVEEDR